ncbi:MAG: hypothetical protein DRG71_00835 [Deltaproteobacteria bacterium]|nr:MAG: hypothetical protein DRG71_00835 [Deltaproteobacteria bacterium]RLB38811.1 MAG: hypothetical protein DRH12_12365 [Deltaproteobacteria bacterium]
MDDKWQKVKKALSASFSLEPAPNNCNVFLSLISHKGIRGFSTMMKFDDTTNILHMCHQMAIDFPAEAKKKVQI